MFHVAATIFGSLSMLIAGAKVVVLTPFGYRDPGIVAGLWRIAGELRATLLGGVPTAFAAALAHDPGDADLSAVRASVCGAALTPVAVSTGVERVTGKPMREVYGMTEFGGVICVDPVWTTRVQGSAGLPVAFCEVQARRFEATHSSSTLCNVGETGVLVVRGPQVSPGYLGGTLSDELLTADGWLVTGDLGRVDADGRVFITGRAKDLIIRGGHNIDPAVIEDCLRAHPDVADAAAVGMPDAYAGEVPMAYVVLRQGSNVTEEALLVFAAGRIAERPALPKFVRILDHFPLTAVGKPYKPALRLAAAREHFSVFLKDQPVSHFQVSHDSGRRLLLQIGWMGSLPEKTTLIERLQAYAVGVEFVTGGTEADAMAIAQR